MGNSRKINPLLNPYPHLLQMQGDSFWFLVVVIFLNVDTTIKHAILSENQDAIAFFICLLPTTN